MTSRDAKIDAIIRPSTGILFPCRDCTRCGGTAKYPSTLDGGRCWGCNGTRVKVTPKARGFAAAWAQIKRRASEPFGTEVRVGEFIARDGRGGGPFGTSRPGSAGNPWVQIISIDDAGTFSHGSSNGVEYAHPEVRLLLSDWSTRTVSSGHLLRRKTRIKCSADLTTARDELARLAWEAQPKYIQAARTAQRREVA